MKTVVFNDSGREIEFKPDVVFNKYLELNEADLKKVKSLEAAICPGCRSSKKQNVFKKSGFQYVECQECRTVYLSPCPNDREIREHYLNSDSSKFWRDELSKQTAGKRREKIYEPRLQWIFDMVKEYLPEAKCIADLRDRNGDYAQAFLKLDGFKQKLIVDPYHPASGTEVVGKVDIITAFEVLDCTGDTEQLMADIKELLVPNGLCFLTTISISGFDLQVLWDKSQTIFPLDRIKLFSKQGLKRFFERHGFEVLEYSTPGLLDVDIVKNTMERDPKLELPRFVRTLIEQGNEQIYKDFQDFLQINRLSSFTRILLRRKK